MLSYTLNIKPSGLSGQGTDTALEPLQVNAVAKYSVRHIESERILVGYDGGIWS